MGYLGVGVRCATEVVPVEVVAELGRAGEQRVGAGQRRVEPLVVRVPLGRDPVVRVARVEAVRRVDAARHDLRSRRGWMASTIGWRAMRFMFCVSIVPQRSDGAARIVASVVLRFGGADGGGSLRPRPEWLCWRRGAGDVEPPYRDRPRLGVGGGSRGDQETLPRPSPANSRCRNGSFRPRRCGSPRGRAARAASRRTGTCAARERTTRRSTPRRLSARPVSFSASSLRQQGSRPSARPHQPRADRTSRNGARGSKTQPHHTRATHSSAMSPKPSIPWRHGERPVSSAARDGVHDGVDV